MPALHQLFVHILPSNWSTPTIGATTWSWWAVGNLSKLPSASSSATSRFYLGYSKASVPESLMRSRSNPGVVVWRPARLIPRTRRSNVWATIKESRTDPWIWVTCGPRSAVNPCRFTSISHGNSDIWCRTASAGPHWRSRRIVIPLQDGRMVNRARKIEVKFYRLRTLRRK